MGERTAFQQVALEGAPIPSTFWGYVKSFGPGIVVVLTWLGARQSHRRGE